MDISALDAASDEESKMEIDAFTKGKRKARTPNHNRKLLACFNCRKLGHMAKECKVPSTQCMEYNSSKIQTTTEESATSWDQGSCAIQGMSFDEAKAFFYDMHDVKDKGKAKAL